MKWIRASDRLPLKDDEVLGYDVFHHDVYVCVLAGTDDDNRPWFSPVHKDTDDLSIRYWMPIPAPPNVEEPDRDN